MRKPIKCLFFGCCPGPNDWPGDEGPWCYRCGHEVSYGDLVGDVPVNKLKDFCKYWLFRKWFPEKCGCCRRRYGDHKHCLPF